MKHETSSQGGIEFINLSKGEFVVSHLTQDEDDWKPYETKKGETRYKEKFDNLPDVFLKGINIKEKTYEGETYLEFELALQGSEGSEGVLTMRVNSPYAKGFFSRIESVDLAKPMDIKVFNIYDKEKKQNKYFMSITQGGQKIANAYSKETDYTGPSGRLPELKKWPLPNGKKMWDASELNAFFVEMAGRINKQLGVVSVDQQSEEGEPDEENEQASGKGDTPF